MPLSKTRQPQTDLEKKPPKEEGMGRYPEKQRQSPQMVCHDLDRLQSSCLGPWFKEERVEGVASGQTRQELDTVTVTGGP